MRTTVTLDKDVERLLRDAMHRTRRSFKETLNRAVRTALGPAPASRSTSFVVRARMLRLKSGLDPAGFNKLADELETDAFIDAHARPASDDRP